jgi:hypothetical protein
MIAGSIGRPAAEVVGEEARRMHLPGVGNRLWFRRSHITITNCANCCGLVRLQQIYNEVAISGCNGDFFKQYLLI